MKEELDVALGRLERVVQEEPHDIRAIDVETRRTEVVQTVLETRHERLR